MWRSPTCAISPAISVPARRGKSVFSPEEFRLIAERLRGHTRYLYFHVMGEPLLHPQLSQLLAIAAALDFRVCITTNGTLLPRQAETLLSAPALHKVSVSLHSFEGNGGGDMAEYLRGVWDFCTRAGQQGVLCALRLWNEGGADARNGEILRFLSTAGSQDVENLPADSVGNNVFRRSCFWNRPGNSTGRHRRRRKAASSSATPCASSWPCCATARRCPAVWTARAAWRWAIC